MNFKKLILALIIIFLVIFSYQKLIAHHQTKNTSIEPNNEEIAVSLVKELPEVQKWLNLFSETKNEPSNIGPPGTPIIEFDHMKDQLYVVHVYELVNDLKSSHTATFNWYDVNLETKEIKAEF